MGDDNGPGEKSVCQVVEMSEVTVESIDIDSTVDGT